MSKGALLATALAIPIWGLCAFGQAPADKKAEEGLARAFLADPANANLARALCRTYVQRNAGDEAIAVIRRYLDMGGQIAIGYELEGELLFSKKYFTSAFEALTKAATLSHVNPRVHELLGLVHVNRRQTGEALRELRLAAEQDPGDAQIQYWLGRVLYSNAEYAQARDTFLSCLKMRPSYPKASENLGLTYEALGDEGSALSSYLQAIDEESKRLERKRAEPYIYYGTCLATLNEPDKALEALQNALRIRPDSFRANFELGRILLQRGNLTAAERYLSEAEKVYPSFSRTQYLLASLYQKLNRETEARRKLETFKVLDADASNRDFPESPTQ